jgi:hypothetical protein
MMHAVLLLSVGLLVSNRKINFEAHAPQNFLSTTGGSSHYLRQPKDSSWTYGVPSLFSNSSYLVASSNEDHFLNSNEKRHYVGNDMSSKNNTASKLFGYDRVDRSKRLEFVHITKTGGSAIEMGAAAAGIQWGVCHYRRIPRLGCNSTADWVWPRDRNFPRHMVNKTLCEPWHTPPHWLIPNPQPSGHNNNVSNFIVVRDPYQRVLSEYYCPSFGYNSPLSNHIGTSPRNASDNAETLNAWIVDKLLRDPIHHGHLMPQHYYVFDHITGDRLIDHVIRYEDLENEFRQLMELYGLLIRLPSKRVSQAAMLVVDTTSRLTVADMTLDTIRVINDYYRLDFDLLGYKMITHI